MLQNGWTGESCTGKTHKSQVLWTRVVSSVLPAVQTSRGQWDSSHLCLENCSGIVEVEREHAVLSPSQAEREAVGGE